ncbi:hypothetical protein [Halalkalibacillus sediminis]|uniref:hypothetical protein n=1 Tax=Halalkalibacillus sediminis TaxID=2018042 RepID=UPI00139013C7|nr:hypothetical protein [Halalkalibacillus sediminis]
MRSTKIMLLGIAIMLLALYIPEFVRTGGYEVYLLSLGFIVVMIGFFKKDEK